MDNRYWSTPVPRKPSKIGCGMRKRTRRRKRGPEAAARRSDRKAYRKAFDVGAGLGLKAWLRLRDAAAA